MDDARQVFRKALHPEAMEIDTSELGIKIAALVDRQFDDPAADREFTGLAVDIVAEKNAARAASRIRLR